jgi:hypothetical protein
LLLQLILLPVALSSILCAIYWSGLHGAFIFDDFPNIAYNAQLRAFDGSFQSLIAAASSGTSSPWGRPLSMASFALNFHFFGEAPFSFKLTNLLIHFANAMMVFVLVRELWWRLGYDTRTPWSLAPAIWITAVWALHPVNLTPVLFVVQRMTSLAAFFILAALTLYLYGRQAKGKAGAFAIAVSLLLCWPAAILSKETGLLLPLYIFLIEWLLLGTFRSVPVRVKWLGLAVLGALFAALCWANWGFITGGYSVRDFTLTERLLTEARVLWFYLRQLLVPASDLFGLFHDDIAISRGLVTPPATVLAIGAWLALVALAFQQRSRRPLFAFAVFWFLASHLLESTVLPLEIAYEHRNYLASLGIFLWLASLLFPELQNARWRIPRLVLAASFVFYCGLLTSVRSVQWGDELHRIQTEVNDHPGSARANYRAAQFIMQWTFASGAGNPKAYQMAQRHLQRAAELDRHSKAALMGLLYLDCAAGKPKNLGIQTSLRERFSFGHFSHGDRNFVQSLSTLLTEKRLCLDDQEVKQLIDAGVANPYADGAMRGLLYAVAMDYAAANMHSVPLALTYAQAAVASDPGAVALRVRLIYLYLQSNRVDDARREYSALASRQLSARDKPGMDQLKNIFDAMEKNAKTH